jgi:hypothetical protein
VNHLQRFKSPTLLNQNNERMPNTGEWQDRHVRAINAPRALEAPIVRMIAAWAEYADSHRRCYESSIGEDYVLGEAWVTLARGIHALLDGETGRLDCGTLSTFIHDTLKAEGIETL